VADLPLKNMLVVAGGTGGHVYPALAVALEMQKRGYAVHWLGTEAGLEARVVPAAGFELHFIRVQGLRGKGLWARLRGLFIALLAICQAVGVVRQLRPVCVLGMGGYVSGPAGLACRLLGKPLVIHEQNSVAGTTNRILSRFAERILAAYPAAFGGEVEATIVGNPVRAEVLQSGEKNTYDYSGEQRLKLLIVGGSLGARAINEALPQTLALLGGLQLPLVRHQTGTAHGKAVKAAYESAGISGVEVVSYIEDMAAAYLWADLVLCRAGALTLAELMVMGRPSILVPLPHSIDNHQFHNAEWMVQVGASLLLPQAELQAEKLAQLLRQLAGNPARLAAMAHAARNSAQLGATSAVADVCEEVQSERA
jgi:UDP-N-acetylglucosamine--N-acetylmuramyl-(pentapeptide) pyrophosphoryl-undecaprenol N-acetylglucosamine transferase